MRVAFETGKKITMKEKLELKIIAFISLTDDLRDKWKELESANEPYIFQRYSWNAYWCQIFREVYHFHIILISIQSKPVAIFPMCINKRGMIRFLQFIGTGQSDYLSPLIDKNFNFSKVIWEMVLAEIKGSYDIIRLDKMPDKIKGEENQFIQPIGAKISGLSFGLRLPDTYLEFDSSLKRSFRNDNKRNLKRLAAFRNLQFLKVDISSNVPLDFRKYIDVSLEQKARRLKNYMGNKTLEDSLVQNFYRNSYLIEDDKYKLDFTVLTVTDNNVLATHWGFFDNDRYYFLFPTMEGKEWYKYSCGKVLIDHLIEFAISKRLKFYDFTIGDENYKKDWCNEQMSLFSYMKAKSLPGFLYLYYHEIIARIRANKYAKTAWRDIKARIVQSRKRK